MVADRVAASPAVALWSVVQVTSECLCVTVHHSVCTVLLHCEWLIRQHHWTAQIVSPAAPCHSKKENLCFKLKKMELLQMKITFGTKLGLKKPSLDKALMAFAWACSCCTVLLACKNSVNPSRRTTSHDCRKPPVVP